MNQPDSNLDYRKLFVEFTVILMGVLIALVAESWWSEREHRRFEAELREDMVAEFVDNIEILNGDIASNEESALRFAELTELTDEALQALPDDLMNRKYRLWNNWAGFDPQLGNVQALVDSGNIADISDRELRLRLSRWAGLLKEKDRYMANATQATLRTIIPTAAKSSADLVWTPAERRELQTQYVTTQMLHAYMLENQRRLLEAAQQIHEYLRSE